MDVDGLLDTGTVLEKDEEQAVEAFMTCGFTQHMPVEVAFSDEDVQIEQDIAQSECKLCTVNIASEYTFTEQETGLALVTDASDIESNAKHDTVTSSNIRELTHHKYVQGKDDLQRETVEADFAEKRLGALVTVALSSSQCQNDDVCRQIVAAADNNRTSTDPSSLTRFSELIVDSGEDECVKRAIDDSIVNSADDSKRNLSVQYCANFRCNIVSVEVHGIADENKFCSAAVAGNDGSAADTVHHHAGVSAVSNSGNSCDKIPHNEGALIKNEGEHGLRMNLESDNSYCSREIASNIDNTTVRPSSDETVLDAVMMGDSNCDVHSQRCDLDVESLSMSSRGSIERFLAPGLPANRGITTPVDDPGFAKVPGYTSELAVMEEEDVKDICASEHAQSDIVQQAVTIENIDGSAKVSNSSRLDVCPELDKKLDTVDETEQVVMRRETVGARSRTSRPNSLLGLSKPNVDLSDSCRELQQSDNSTVTSAACANAMRMMGETDTASAFLQPRQRPVLSMISAEKGRPNSLSLSQRPVSWSPAPVLQSPSISSSKRPSSLNLSLGLSQEAVPRNIGPTETKCRRRMLRCGLQTSFPVESEDPSAAAVTLHVPSFQRPGTEPYSARPTALCIPSLSSPSPQVAPVSASGAASERDCASCVTGTSTSTEQTTSPSSQALPLNQHRAEVLSNSSGSESSTPLNNSVNVSGVCELGKVAPVWLPDSSAPRCMHCDCRFTFTRRRHHCRACGKVVLLTYHTV